MHKIIFICHGNICRSPMAEFVMKDIVNKQQQSANYEIASCATSREEIGNPVYPPVKKLLAQKGISCEGKSARQFSKEDYDHYDMLIVMDEYNKANLKRMCNNDPQKKISMLLDHAKRLGESVSDPWYTRDFNKCYDDILAGCLGLFAALNQ
ncbi:MAG: low molecular weight phosphotyrosine protein phosphatase [Erysipelotrichaceae bacterium]|nr:low molecular weight phosphotyrosine protein phosphatase [Erysipelotrichaceae bacterium]MDY5252344.1 low molecular weight protein-tyrosine-phosphatase [Erysipelotrichaceae bacterium]